MLDHGRTPLSFFPAVILAGSVLVGSGTGCGAAPGGPPVSASQGKPEAETTASPDQPSEGRMRTRHRRKRAPAADPKPAATADEPQGSQTQAPPETQPAELLAHSCERLCHQVDVECTADNARKCRASCKLYEAKAKGCETQYQKAFECQLRGDKGELCSQVASARCADEFRAARACERGEVAAPPPEAPQNEIADWTSISDSKLGFSVLMPPDSARDDASPNPLWKGQLGGNEYVVTAHPAPPTDLGKSTLVRLVLSFVGSSCQKGLRLHGQYETKGTTILRYDSGCPNGTEWHGTLHIAKDYTFSTAVHSKAGSAGIQDPFFLSFKR